MVAKSGKSFFNILRPICAGLFVAYVAVTTHPLEAQAPQPVTPAMEQRIDAMVKKLTLAQKIVLLGGEDGLYLRGEPSIGLPRVKMSDGPLGVRTWGPSTAYAAGISLAASWDRTLAQRVGVMLGQDARARGVGFLLAPGVTIYRSPVYGRNFECFGEDPYLDGQIAVSYTQGVQSQGVIATAKTYVANDADYDRHRENAIIGERALREIYLPVFEAAVKQGHVGAIMNSYNLINGEHATQNAFLDNQVLRKEWGFRGILMSDWGGTYDGIAAANAGLDLEMGDAEFMTAKTLIPAIENGKVPEAVIDEKVRRILRTAMQFGFFDREQTDPSIPLFNPQADAIALQSAEEGAVLLKNEGNLLPLNPHKTHSIAVIGPDAYPAVPGGGGSSEVTAFAPVSFMTGLSTALYPTGTKVYWNAGIKTPAEIFSGTSWCVDSACKNTGLLRTEYIQATNAKTASGEDDQMNSLQNPGGEDWNPGYRRVEWNGYYLPKTSGVYRVVAATVGEDSYKVLLDGQQILEVPTHENGQAPKSALVKLEAGKPAKIQFIYWPMTEQKTAGLGVIAESRLLNPAAIHLARMVDVAVVSVGFGPSTEGEGLDRTYQLPFGQEELIQAVAAVNPRTIVVLTAGGSVATQDWLDKVPALLQTWYAGQEAGNALEKILLGEVNPSGKLPMSWEKKIEDNPTYKNYYEAPGSRNVNYAEGIFLGYRYYDKSHVKPLFPFGFGLSYTSFAFSNLEVTPQVASQTGSITVGFDVKNTGSRAGAEVAQVYVGDPSATVPRPVRELKGFSRVSLAPGESRHVTVTLNRRSLAYWDTITHNWEVDPGKFVVYVGDSSRNIPLQKSFYVH
ncbi:MAG: glycoside hydrolase family 3 C-terminal domain-containing protein [Acidobacteriaceae bacterium]